MKATLTLLIFFLTQSEYSRGQAPLMSLFELQDSIKALMDDYHIPGLFFTMVKQDAVMWQGGLGTTGIEQQLINDSTLFKMGSVTKSIAALAILKLAERGQLSLDDKLNEIAPELSVKNQWEATHPVRIVHLLEHTAGFDAVHLHAYYHTKQPGLSTLAIANYHKKSLYCRWKPGTRHSYTNVGYIVLSYLIEKISGQSYQQFVQEALFQPLGMSCSGFDIFSMAKNETKGYVSNSDEEAELIASFALAGDLESCAKDMTQLLRFFLQDGKVDGKQILKSHSIHRMESTGTTVGSRVGLDDYYGLGNTLGHSTAKFTFRGHGGGVPGFVSYYGYNREAKIGYAVAINHGGGLYPIRALIVDFLTQGLEKPAPAQVPLAKVNKNYVSSFLGYYQYSSSKDQLGSFIDRSSSMRLFLKEERLYWKAGDGDATELIPLSDSTFRYKTINLATVALTRDDTGEPIVTTLNGYYENISFLRFVLLKSILYGSVILSISILPLGIAWSVKWFKKRISNRNTLTRLCPVLTVFIPCIVLSLTLYLLVFKRETIGSRNIYEIAIYLGTLAFPLMAIISLFLALYHLIANRRNILNYYLVLVGLSLCILAAFFATIDLVGFRFWNY